MVNRRRIAVRTALSGAVGNGLLALIKGAVGIAGNSSALIADAVESFGDMLSSLITVFGLRYATLPPDDNHPYGHGKAEPLITFVTVAVLAVSAAAITWHSITNLFIPREAPEAYTLYILGGIIVIKEGLFRYVRRRNQDVKSTALEADAWHHRSDALTSAAGFVGIAAAVYLGEGFEHADDWAALFACGIILYNAYRIFRPALGEVMDEHKYPELEAEVRRLSENTAGVTGTEKCYVRKTGFHFLVDLHLRVNGEITVRAGHEIAHAVKDRVRRNLPEVADVHIHVEPEQAR